MKFTTGFSMVDSLFSSNVGIFKQELQLITKIVFKFYLSMVVKSFPCFDLSDISTRIGRCTHLPICIMYRYYHILRADTHMQIDTAYKKIFLLIQLGASKLTIQADFDNSSRLILISIGSILVESAHGLSVSSIILFKRDLFLLRVFIFYEFT